uniref:Uncharacterized protein n=1 Tax=Oryza punctata TaxID=4537 RepID=A0A0E0LGM3_ORYPU
MVAGVHRKWEREGRGKAREETFATHEAATGYLEVALHLREAALTEQAQALMDSEAVNRQLSEGLRVREERAALIAGREAEVSRREEAVMAWELAQMESARAERAALDKRAERAALDKRAAELEARAKEAEEIVRGAGAPEGQSDIAALFITDESITQISHQDEE